MQDINDVDVIPKDSIFQVFTLGRLALIFLFALPLFLGLAFYLVPLQVGASTIAFPRAAALSFWTWLLGAIVLVVAYASNGGPAGGRANAVDLAYVALATRCWRCCWPSVCVATTVVTLRAPGLRLDHVPMFSWAMLVASSIWLLSLPVLIANILLIYIDHRLGRPSDFGVGLNQWPQIAWVVQQPQVFAFAIPVLGVVGDVVATMSGARQKNRGVMFAAIGAFGILSFGAWAQPFFNDEVTTQWLYVGMAFAILLPMLALFGGCATTMRAGKPRARSRRPRAPCSPWSRSCGRVGQRALRDRSAEAAGHRRSLRHVRRARLGDRGRNRRGVGCAGLLGAQDLGSRPPATGWLCWLCSPGSSVR